MFYLSMNSSDDTKQIIAYTTSNIDIFLNFDIRNKGSNIDDKLFEISDENEEEFLPYLDVIPNQNHRILVSGKSGCGKSTLIGKLLDQLMRTNPKRIIIISTVSEDPELDRYHGDIIPLRLDISDSDAVVQLELDYFADSVLVFDDVEKTTKKEFKKWVMALRAEAFEAGRHKNIDIISISHDLLGGMENKTVKAECTAAILFPQFNQPHQTREFLRKYIGMDKNMMEHVMRLPSRYVFINANSPCYIVSQKEVRII